MLAVTDTNIADPCWKILYRTEGAATEAMSGQSLSRRLIPGNDQTPVDRDRAVHRPT